MERSARKPGLTPEPFVESGFQIAVAGELGDLAAFFVQPHPAAALFYMGVDLGKLQDFTALPLIKRAEGGGFVRSGIWSALRWGRRIQEWWSERCRGSVI